MAFSVSKLNLMRHECVIVVLCDVITVITTQNDMFSLCCTPQNTLQIAPMLKGMKTSEEVMVSQPIKAERALIFFNATPESHFPLIPAWIC